jgi:uncharacterized protein YcbX
MACKSTQGLPHDPRRLPARARDIYNIYNAAPRAMLSIASTNLGPQRDAASMTGTIAALYRYPVKGLSPEKLDRIVLSPGNCLPQDRRFAIALPSTRFDPENPQWLAKTHFVMLMRDEALALLHTRFDPETAERDLDTVNALRRHFGHNLMGIYAEVTEGGDITVGDRLTVRG